MEPELQALQEVSSREQPQQQEVYSREHELKMESGVSPSGVEQELIPLQKMSETPHHQDTASTANSSKLRQMMTDLTSLLRELNWEGLVIVTCLCLAYLLCNASYAIISPFFPKEASCSSRYCQV